MQIPVTPHLSVGLPQDILELAGLDLRRWQAHHRLLSFASRERG
jgi:hypothetical protein